MGGEVRLYVDMPTLEIQIPVDHHRINRECWSLIVNDSQLAKFRGKIESNRHGQVIMMPPASGSHSSRQGEIGFQLRTLMGSGRSLPECPISTVNGVRAADVAWYSDKRFAEVEGQLVFEKAPEICVEVLSPSNTELEMQEKRYLYFEAGSEECWICGLEGEMAFYYRDNPNKVHNQSLLCPEFPQKIE